MVHRTNRLYSRAAQLCTVLTLLWLPPHPVGIPALTTGTAAQMPGGSTSFHPIEVQDDRPDSPGDPLPAGRQLAPPPGYIAFCMRMPANCMGGSDHPSLAHLSPERWRELNDVNDYVNSSIPERDDISLYGRQEYWTYADSTHGGDCEDLALLKQRLLLERGWPLDALSIAVVRRWNGEGHAVLLVATDRGDLVLDNLTWKVLPWRQAPYAWVMRQSHRRPYIWVSLDPDGGETAAAPVSFPPLGSEPPFVVAVRRMKQITASLAGASPTSLP